MNSFEEQSRPLLSFILCSRNDQYMGNSRWRLQTALNYVSQQVAELAVEKEVEILVSDWGSETPLSQLLELTPVAARITKFINIPRAIATELQQDSPFAEVFALNAAARRAQAEYIGRIDQDTLVGKRFLRAMLDIGKKGQRLSMGFANIKMINYRFAVRCPPLSSVARFIKWFVPHLATENARSNTPYYFAGVGIWLLHRDLWFESGGYDERMIYMNAMETNMILRLLPKYEMVDLGKLSDYDFYHLEHYHPWTVRKTSIHRKVNPHLPFSQPDKVNPNGGVWGLRDYSFEVVSATPGVGPSQSKHSVLSFLLLMLRVGPVISFDWLGLTYRRHHNVWKHRLSLVLKTIKGQPLVAWPSLLKKLWKQRSVSQLPSGIEVSTTAR